MSQDTDALLRAILFQALTARDTNFLIHAIKAMCSKDLIAAVEKEVQELDAERSRQD